MLLSLQNVNKTYYSGDIAFQALKDINLDFQNKEFTVIAGPSGSGKTTLLNCIGCLDRAESGRILFEGDDLLQKTNKELALFRRASFGFIFQTYNLVPVLTAYEIVEMPLKLLGSYSDAEIHDRVMDILTKVQLQDLAQRRPLELSGGQQQRVSIARALVKKPKVILADEPTANLDSKTGESIIELMHNLNEEESITFLFSTHDTMVMQHARRLIGMIDGSIAEDKKN